MRIKPEEWLVDRGNDVTAPLPAREDGRQMLSVEQVAPLDWGRHLRPSGRPAPRPRGRWRDYGHDRSASGLGA
jgi:hypothetical protein